MRTSLLLQREPFGRIVCETLSAYWQARAGKPHHVEWHPRNPGARYFQRHGLQAWFGNIYLNFFAVSFAPDEAFEPLRQEYMRSVSRWRRWLQRKYVEHAMSRAGRERLAQTAIGVWPGVYDAHDCIILGGNRRLRLLQPARRVTTVVLKAGFASEYLAEDVRVRTTAAPGLSCAPSIGSYSLEQGWYEESWVSGIPVNRLERSKTQMVIEAGHRVLATQLIEPSLREDRVPEYLGEIARRIATVLDNLEGDSAELSRRVRNLHEQLVAELRRTGGDSGSVITAATHGDLQDANLLWDHSEVKIIDWENSRRRLAAYDMLFYAVGTTTGLRWGETFSKLLLTPSADLPAYMQEWPGMDWTTECRRTTMILFLLEQLPTMLEEDCSAVFYHSGRTFLDRIPQFTAAVEAIRKL